MPPGVRDNRHCAGDAFGDGIEVSTFTDADSGDERSSVTGQNATADASTRATIVSTLSFLMATTFTT
jgi:hypothetical protein